MLYQLPDGRTVEISIHDYLDFTDEELRALVGYNYGEELSNPLYGSAITKPGRPEPEEPSDYNELNLDEIPLEHKLKDQDYTPESE